MFVCLYARVLIKYTNDRACCYATYTEHYYTKCVSLHEISYIDVSRTIFELCDFEECRVTQGYCKWRHSIDRIRSPIGFSL